MLRRALFLFLSLIAFSTVTFAKMGFAFVPTVEVSPAAIQAQHAGPFGLTFLTAPQMRFHPQPTIPKALLKAQQEGFARAALHIGRDGRVLEVKILEASPVDVVEKDATAFFERVVYQPQDVGEFETDVVLLFREAKK